MDNWGIYKIFGIMDIVYRVLPLVCRVTLEITGTTVVIGVDVTLDILLCITRSVI